MKEGGHILFSNRGLTWQFAEQIRLWVKMGFNRKNQGGSWTSACHCLAEQPILTALSLYLSLANLAQIGIALGLFVQSGMSAKWWPLK